MSTLINDKSDKDFYIFKAVEILASSLDLSTDLSELTKRVQYFMSKNPINQNTLISQIYYRRDDFPKSLPIFEASTNFINDSIGQGQYYQYSTTAMQGWKPKYEDAVIC
jgi:hypothetical protein